MVRRLIVTVLVAGSLFVARPVMAQEATDCVQVTQYGGAVGIVCGAKHEPVETGLADINPIVLASIFFGLAGMASKKANNLKRAEVAL